MWRYWYSLLVLKRVLGAGWRSVPEVHELRWHPGEEMVAVGHHLRGEREQRVPVGAGVERVVYLHGKKKPRRVCPPGVESLIRLLVESQDEGSYGNDEGHETQGAVGGDGMYHRYKHSPGADDEQDDAHDSVVSFIGHSL